jgi:hypothetical protein
MSLNIGNPTSGGKVCHMFGASGTVTPSGTAVTGKILDQNGNPLLDSNGNPIVGRCTTVGTNWICQFTLPSSLAAGTSIQVEVDSASPSQSDSVGAQVDNC